MYVCMFSEITGQIEANHVELPWDRGRKFIQMVQVICCSSLLSASEGGGGAFSRDITINFSTLCRAFSRALKTEQLKAPLFPGPVGAGTTTDWCITISKLSSLQLVSSGEQVSLRLNWSQTPKTHFLVTWLDCMVGIFYSCPCSNRVSVVVFMFNI